MHGVICMRWGRRMRFARRVLRCGHIAMPAARHQAHGHGIAQQATQDQHEDEEDGQSATHAADLSEPPPALP